MKDIFGKIVAVVIIVAMIAAGVWHFYAVNQAYDRGAQAEKTKWKAAVAAAEMKATQQRVEAQDQIDKVEQVHWAEKAEQDIKVGELKDALSHEKKALATCDALSDRLSDALRAVH